MCGVPVALTNPTPKNRSPHDFRAMTHLGSSYKQRQHSEVTWTISLHPHFNVCPTFLPGNPHCYLATNCRASQSTHCIVRQPITIPSNLYIAWQPIHCLATHPLPRDPESSTSIPWVQLTLLLLLCVLPQLSQLPLPSSNL